MSRKQADWAQRPAQRDQLLALVTAAEAREQSTILMVRTVRGSRDRDRDPPVLGAALDVPGFEPLRGEVVRIVPHGASSYRVTLRVECAHVRAVVRA